MHLTLEVISGPHAGFKFAFERHETFLVGRDPRAHLALTQDRDFSPHHFLLEVNPPDCYLRDLGSRNGTRVNGVRVQEAALTHGDVISVGDTTLRVIIEASPEREIFCQVCHRPSMMATMAAAADDPTSSELYVCAGCRTEQASSPQPVPGYALIRQLGRGGMGTVHLARRLSNGEVVAIKMILPECAVAEKAVQLFLREASILSQLDHRRIVRFLEVGMSRGQFFLVMEYVEPLDLRQTLNERSGKRRIQFAASIACQVLEALRYAHRLGFVHRDIKPANVLLTREAQRMRTKLADFGLSKNFENGGFSGITRQGDIRGSLPYMPPEQIIDCRFSKPCGDIYSTGATLYRLLSDKFPHEFPESVDPFAVILDRPIIPLQERCPELPSGLVDVVHQALARDPAKRFESANAMHQALLPFAQGTFRTNDCD